ncbi:MAG: helix-turn-helix domain-containing protein [Nitrospinae bacterium]|nr:helix-turn-helix domain-containing protein [Nitrospinota bacterium]
MVENFGLYLKNERELRGVALKEIAQSTKIHIRFLEALENNDFDNMPGEVFVKGFIRSYARVIGFDSEEMVNAYDESVGRDRREEFEKVQVIKEEIQARKKTVKGYIFGGIALVVIFFPGIFSLR